MKYNLAQQNKASITKSMFGESKFISPRAFKTDDFNRKLVSFSVFIISINISSPADPSLTIVSATLCLFIHGSLNSFNN